MNSRRSLKGMVMLSCGFYSHHEGAKHTKENFRIYFFVLFVSLWCVLYFSEMAERFRMLVDAVVKHGDALRVGQAAVLGTPTRSVPSVAVLQQALEDQARDLAVRHQAVQVLV